MFSIIMPSFNQVAFIERAIESVLNQGNIEIELLITDGGSTDGTVDLLVEQSKTYSNLNWISEADTGPADALNKSLARSRGTIIGWLNSDDCYKPNIFQNITQYFLLNPESIMVYGQGEYIDADGEVLSLYPTERPDAGLEGLKSGCFICQPTVFFKRSLYLLQGPFNTQYKASFDYEYWYRAFSKFPHRIGFLDDILAQSRLHEQAITHRNRQTIAIEGARLGAAYFDIAPIHWLVTFIEEHEKKTSIQFSEMSALEQNNIFAKFAPYCAPKEIDSLRRDII